MNKKRKKAFQSLGGGSKKDLFDAFEIAKGVTAESRTLDLLNGPSKPSWLLEARPTPEKDKMGIDMELDLADGSTTIPVNIKSSQRGLFNHIEKRKKINGKFVVVLIVRPFDTDEQILKNIALSLQRYRLGKERHKKGIKKPVPKK